MNRKSCDREKIERKIDEKEKVGNMNNEKSSIYQEYSQIEEKNQWMVIYQVTKRISRLISVSAKPTHIIIRHFFLRT